MEIKEGYHEGMREGRKERRREGRKYIKEEGSTDMKEKKKKRKDIKGGTFALTIHARRTVHVPKERKKKGGNCSAAGGGGHLKSAVSLNRARRRGGCGGMACSGAARLDWT